jgi:hypothetical protein
MKRRAALSLKQQSVAEGLGAQFGIDVERVYFLNSEKPDEPWIPAESLMVIARQSGNFQTLDESFDQFIPQLNQIVHRATVLTKDGRQYTRSGVATVGESDELDEHSLAAGRAVSAVLTAAGFNPLRPGAVVELDLRLRADAQAGAGLPDDVMTRNSDLKRIHALAAEKGLAITVPGGGWDRTEYRRFLMENYKTNTAAGFDALQRASLINALEQLPDAVQDEFRDVA